MSHDTALAGEKMQPDRIGWRSRVKICEHRLQPLTRLLPLCSVLHSFTVSTALYLLSLHLYLASLLDFPLCTPLGTPRDRPQREQARGSASHRTKDVKATRPDDSSTHTSRHRDRRYNELTEQPPLPLPSAPRQVDTSLNADQSRELPLPLPPRGLPSEPHDRSRSLPRRDELLPPGGKALPPPRSPSPKEKWMEASTPHGSKFRYTLEDGKMGKMEWVHDEVSKSEWTHGVLPNNREYWIHASSGELTYVKPQESTPGKASPVQQPSPTAMAHNSLPLPPPPQTTSHDTNDVQQKLLEASKWQTGTHKGQPYWYNVELQISQWNPPDIILETRSPGFQRHLQPAKVRAPNPRLQEENLDLSKLFVKTRTRYPNGANGKGPKKE